MILLQIQSGLIQRVLVKLYGNLKVMELSLVADRSLAGLVPD